MMRPILTDYMNLNGVISFATRINDSLVFAEDSQLYITSPQNLNRATSGLQHFKYSHNHLITDAVGICMDGTIAAQSLPENERESIPISLHKETHILFLDKAGYISVYDTSRSFISSTFKYPNSRDIISFAGSDEKPCEFAIIEKNKLKLCQLGYNKYDIIQEREIPPCSKILAFNGSYLLQFEDKIVRYKDGTLDDFYQVTAGSSKSITDFKVDNGRVIVITTQGDNCIIRVVGTKAVGIRKFMNANNWDVHDGWIVVYLKGDLLGFVNVENPDLQQVVNLNGLTNSPMKIITGNSRYDEKYTVTIIMPTTMAMLTIPFPILTGEVEPEPIDETIKQSYQAIKAIRRGGK